MCLDGSTALRKQRDLQLVGKACGIDLQPLCRFRIIEAVLFRIIGCISILWGNLKRFGNMPRLLPKLSFVNDTGGRKRTRLVRARLILRKAKRFLQYIIQIPRSTKFCRAHMHIPLSCPDLILQ